MFIGNSGFTPLSLELFLRLSLVECYSCAAGCVERNKNEIKTREPTILNEIQNLKTVARMVFKNGEIGFQLNS